MSFKRLESGLLVPEFNIQPFGVNLRRAVDAASMGTLVGAKPPATLLFGADFEEADLTDWAATDSQNGGVIDAHADAAHAGSWGSRAYVPTGAADKRAHGTLDLGSPQTEVYIIQYIKISDLICADGDVFEYFRQNSGTYSIRLDIGRSGANYYIGGQYRDGGYQSFPNTTISKTNWVKAEFHNKAESAPAAADGIVKLWLDDVLITDITDATGTTTSSYDTWHVGFRLGVDSGTSGYVYTDDVNAYDTIP